MYYISDTEVEMMRFPSSLAYYFAILIHT